MSRIGNKEIAVPKGVEIKKDGNDVMVKGPKGSLKTALVEGIDVKIENNVVKFSRKDNEGKTKALHGLVRALVANNVLGVTQGFKRELDIVGVGYRAEVKGKEVVFQLGYSHPVRFAIPKGIDIAVDGKSGHITVTGIDKQQVGQVAAEIRSLREPDPYKGKGIKYSNEVIRRKAGKAAGK
ncbi:MAG TPA: 50S ribosomal protein L6 [Thermoanaerobaculia bacterium]|nr:50S ribosomal protein L6 [Thermoanaerobaculia bacterium]